MCGTFFFGTFEVLVFEVLKNVNDRPHSLQTALMIFQLLNQSTDFFNVI